MLHPPTFTQRLAICWLALCTLVTLWAPLDRAQAAPLTEPNATTTVELLPTDDARTQTGSPNTTFDEGFLWVGHPNVHFSLLKFDLSALPTDATINAAALQLTFPGVYTGTNEVEVGRVDGAWEEETLTASTPVDYTWSGQFKTVTSTGLSNSSVISWNVTSLVQAWQAGTQANNGLALRGNGGVLKAAHSKETGAASDRGPKLIIVYTEAAQEGPRPDLGDAPDSDANHVGINNRAYLDGTLGHFPTVRTGTPANQGAGPLHKNVTLEAILGDFLSREGEADTGPDQDNSHNNILDGGVDNSNNDRGDDGWRNRQAAFPHCQRTTVAVRVRKAPNAQRNVMYLNAWFDGNHDGDWQDRTPCPPNEGVPSPVANEWIIQNYVVPLNGIPAGGYIDIPVNTAVVLNNTPDKLHWLRLSLSEIPAPAAAGQLPDGRGPHPTAAIDAYNFGETEDYIVKPHQAGNVGTLEILKQVVTAGEPVEWIDYVTYEIRLRHNGGSQPLEARLRDVLPYPLIVYPTVEPTGLEYVSVDTPTGGAAPLQAQLEVIPPSGATPPQQVVKWQGTLAPNAEIRFTFQVRVLTLCEPNQQTMTFTNTAAARPKDGAAITASDTFTAKCIDYDENNLDVTAEPLDPSDWEDLTQVPVQGTIHNRHPYTVSVGLYQKPLASAIQASALLTTTKPPKPIKLLELPLKPGETKPFQTLLRAAGESDETIPGATEPLAQLGFCLILNAGGDCPDAELAPNLHGNLPISTTVRPSDLGDAPDSTNHFNQPMAAYPNTPANYPTVFDPATGLPPGPRHLHPRPFHLGQRVSREIEADLGPDQDPLNNIEPAANDPDNDRFDDGSRLRNLNNCQPAAADVQVAIRPAAVAYFQQLGAPAYLNVWLDSNRDGDWADGFTCQDAQGQNQVVVEHILIDYPINVVGLGAGLHNLANIATQRVLWPAQLANRPTWVRFTLSDQPANKPLTFGDPNSPIKYGDGRGYLLPFKVGETEDHYRYYGGNDVDLAVQLTASNQQTTKQAAGLQAAAADKLGNFEIQLWKVDVTNLGANAVSNALLEFNIPEKFHGLQPVIVRAPGVTAESISFNFDKLNLTLPSIEPDNLYSVVLGWYGCITCTRVSTVVAADANVDYTGSAKVTANGDSDSSNNQSSATLRSLLRSPFIGGFMDYTDDSCMDHIVSGRAVTNRTTVTLRGTAAPNQIIAILIGLVQAATVNSDANGNFSHTLTLTNGQHLISARYANQVQSASAAIVSPRDPASGQATGKFALLVNTDLPYDPMSVCFTDSNGKAIFLPTFGLLSQYNQAETLASSLVALKRGETYRLSVYGGTEANAALDAGFTLADDLINEALAGKLQDPEGDGFYTGLVTLPAADLQAAAVGATTATTVTLNVANGGVEASFSNAVELASEATITDRATGQPVAGATVVALAAQVNGADVAYVTLPSGTLGQTNPTTSAANGGYSFNVPNGIYRLDVLATGYQPYRTADIAVTNGQLAQNIALSPAVNDATTQRILITANGFSPAQVTVAPGSVVEFVNLDLSDHTTSGAQWDSGVLAAGDSYKVKLSTAGVFTFSDGADANSTGTITVGTPPAGGANNLYLPVVSK